MIFMVLFWIIMVWAALHHYLFKGRKDFYTSDWTTFFLLLAGMFLFAGIITKDPIFAMYGVPQEYEWIVGQGLLAFGFWLYYLKPWKSQFAMLDKRVAALDAEFRSFRQEVRGDLALIKSKLFSSKNYIR